MIRIHILEMIKSQNVLLKLLHTCMNFFLLRNLKEDITWYGEREKISHWGPYQQFDITDIIFSIKP